jgi:hypothetical protein
LKQLRRQADAFWAEACAAALIVFLLPAPADAAPATAITGATLVDVSLGGDPPTIFLMQS